MERNRERRLVSSGSEFEERIGYSRAVVDGDWVLVSGTTGYDYATMTISDSLMEQTEQALRNLESALTDAGASLADVVRVRYLLPDGTRFPECWPLLQQRFGEIRPAATMMQVGLMGPEMLIEIEATARIRSS